MAAFGSDILPILKEWADEKTVHANLFRGSSVLANIKKERAGGRYKVVPMMYSRGGNTTGNFSLVASMTATRALNKAFQVPYGNAFTFFTISPKEWNASDMEGGAFVSIVRELFFAAGETLRQVNGAALYGYGNGDCGIVDAVDTASQLYIDVKQWAAMALDVGSPVVFATGPQPTGALRSASPVYVSTIVDQGNGLIRVTFGSAFAATVAVGDWMLLYGYGSTTSPLNFQGFRAWLPTVGNRTGSTWTSYIATAFCGVDRSAFPTRLAGEFVLRDDAGSETYSNAIIRGIRAVRRNGGVPDQIVLNDYDYSKIIEELDAYKQYFQQINGPSGKVEVTKGLNAMSFAFSTNWLQYVYDDAFCPQGLAYILEMDSWGMAMLTNPKPIDSSLPKTNEAGAPKIGDVGTPPTAYGFNIDDYVAVADADTTDGQGARVTLASHGALFCRYPSHNCVVKLDVTMP